MSWLVTLDLASICGSLDPSIVGSRALSHPENYRLVVFKDMSNDTMVLTRSCANTKETVVYTDGNEYPVVKLEISNTSHPFFTGKLKLVDTAGRVDKFMSKYKKTYKR